MYNRDGPGFRPSAPIRILQRMISVSERVNQPPDSKVDPAKRQIEHAQKLYQRSATAGKLVIRYRRPFVFRTLAYGIILAHGCADSLLEAAAISGISGRRRLFHTGSVFPVPS